MRIQNTFQKINHILFVNDPRSFQAGYTILPQWAPTSTHIYEIGRINNVPKT